MGKTIELKNYNAAPLPFMGQKRNFLKDFREALSNYPRDAIYVDLFGGSGLLSHTVKRFYPDSIVIYNDYDGYNIRLKNIVRTNALLEKIRCLIMGVEKDKRLSNDIKKDILDVLSSERNSGYVDYITVSSWLCFSMKYCESLESLKKQTFYNCVRKNNYPLADTYLEGVTVVSADYRDLYSEYKGKEVIFIIDPPYLQTEKGVYKNFWSLKDYLDVLDVLPGQDYFYFTSNKSCVLELCDWFKTKTGAISPFDGATKVTRTNGVNFQSTYTDIMLYKYESK